MADPAQTGLGRLFSDRVAETLLHGASCPVLLVPAGEGYGDQAAQAPRGAVRCALHHPRTDPVSMRTKTEWVAGGVRVDLETRGRHGVVGRFEEPRAER